MDATLGELSKRVKEIIEAFEHAGKMEKARTLADVIRAMRRERTDILNNLPKGIDGKNHHLWDVKVNDRPLRQVLKELWKEAAREHTPGHSQEGNTKSPLLGGDLGVGKLSRKVHDADNNWRSFCETLGNEIYRHYKQKTGGVSTRFRILGETEYYPEPEKTEHRPGRDNSIPITSTGDVKEWIFVGKLKAVTPFYFGVPSSFNSSREEKDKGSKEERENGENRAFEFEVNEQTSYRILLDKKGRYRIPRSLLRGVLRRDLRIAFGGSGCNVELGGMMPCMCHVCTIMRSITVMDSRSGYTEPPDIRYRIRLNPYTAVVDEGALFDMEVVPEGVIFPFVMRFRGECLPDGLSGVLHLWEDGIAWLGGSGSTGKGRFQLLDLEVFEWDLKEGIKSYIEERGRRGEEGDIAKKAYPKGLKPANLPDKDTLNPYREYLSSQWMGITYEIEISSPLISADTIRALLDGNNHDAIMYEKRVICGNTGDTETVPTIKGETFKGIIRRAVGRRSSGLDIDNHEDCACHLCAIFGNEHEAGKIRFEDLTPIPFGVAQGQHGQTSLSMPPIGAESHIKYKRIDHVAIDRFHGGAEDAMKFDTYALAGSQNNPITLKGRLWIKNEVSEDYQKKIATAFADVRDGLYPLGGKTGVGYGCVSGFKIVEAPAGFKQLIPEKQTPPSVPKTSYPYPALPELGIKPEHIYYPHYFLKPGEKVHREQEMIGHEKFHDEYAFSNGVKEKLVSGKITCKLTTLTPLIIPDTENNDAFGLMAAHPNHENYQFFRIDNQIMIPGSEIRGMISSVYEAITNSCYRIFEDSRYLTRRMQPKKNPSDFDILEFKHPFSLKKLCNVITKDNKDLTLNAPLNTVEWLNALLEISDFYDTLLKIRNSGISHDVNKLVEKTKEYRTKSYTSLYDNQKGNIKKLNRLFLEEIYPDETPKLKKDIKNGVVKGDKIVEVQAIYRLPLYDKIDITNTIANIYKDSDNFKKADTLRQQKIRKAVDWNKVIARVAENNRTFLAATPEKRKKFLQGEEEVPFCLLKGENPKDSIAVLWKAQNSSNFTSFIDGVNNDLTDLKGKLVADNKVQEGRIKFTGINMVNIENVGRGNNSYDDTWDVWELDVLHNDETQWRNSLKRSYPRPQLTFIKGGMQYSIPKRCERIFVVPSRSANPYTIPVNVREQYRNILKDYENNFGHIDDKFRTFIRSKELSDGDLVYFLPEENGKNEIKAVMPVPLSRITDDNPLGERLPNQELRPCIRGYWGDVPDSLKEYFYWNLFSIHPEGLCPACRLFGTTSYRGRVRFGFAGLSNKPKWLIPIPDENNAGGSLTLPLLERPRPTWSIPSDKHNVPGRKFYVHHNGWQEVLKNKDIIPKTENNRTVEPLDKDNEFTFDVYFENLREWELGLLCYCLELEPGMGHKLGMGKPLGFGSVRIAIKRLQTFTVHQDGMNWKSSEDEIEVYLQKGKEKLVEWFTPSTPSQKMRWDEIKHIKDLRSLLGIPDCESTVKYPTLNKDTEGSMPDYTYERLSDTKLLPHDKRVEYLQTPWNPWNAFVKEAGSLNSEKSDEKGNGKKRSENILKKPKPPPSEKSVGTVKWFDESKGTGMLVMGDGRMVSITIDSIRGSSRPKEGQKAIFRIVHKGIMPRAEDVEIVE